MPIRRLPMLGLILLSLFGLLTYFVAVRGPRHVPSTDVGAVTRGLVAPDFTLRDLATGRPVSLKDLRGSHVLLNYWASWCEPCLEEMPSLQELHEKFQARKLVVLGVNVNETEEDLQRLVEQTGVKFPILVEGQAVAQRYGTEKLPETYLIDPRGIVVQKIIGAQHWSSAEALRYFDGLLPR
jgi:peroxiredoxin